MFYVIKLIFNDGSIFDEYIVFLILDDDFMIYTFIQTLPTKHNVVVKKEGNENITLKFWMNE